MAVYLCHEFPDLYEHEATIIDATPGASCSIGLRSIRVAVGRSATPAGSITPQARWT